MNSSKTACHGEAATPLNVHVEVEAVLPRPNGSVVLLVRGGCRHSKSVTAIGARHVRARVEFDSCERAGLTDLHGDSTERV
jgi:hypothetical protein